jgi:WD40 repeat protein
MSKSEKEHIVAIDRDWRFSYRGVHIWGGFAVLTFALITLFTNGAGCTPPTMPPPFDPDAAFVYDLAYSPDGRLIASAEGGRFSARNLARVFDVESGSVHREFRANDFEVHRVLWSPDMSRLYSAGGDSALHAWNVDSRRAIFTTVFLGRMSDMALSPDGARIVTAVGGPNVLIWNATDGGEMHRYKAHPRGVTSCAFSPDGQWLATGGWTEGPNDARVRIWNVGTYTMENELVGHEHRITSLSYSADSTVLASASKNGTIRLWDVKLGVALHVLRTGTYVYCIAFSPTAPLLVSGGTDNCLRIWDSKRGRLIKKVPEPTRIMAAAFSPDGKSLAFAGGHGQLVILDMETNEVRRINIQIETGRPTYESPPPEWMVPPAIPLDKKTNAESIPDEEANGEEPK